MEISSLNKDYSNTFAILIEYPEQGFILPLSKHDETYMIDDVVPLSTKRKRDFSKATEVSLINFNSKYINNKMLYEYNILTSIDARKYETPDEDFVDTLFSNRDKLNNVTQEALINYRRKVH